MPEPASALSPASTKVGRVRWTILALIFFATTINYLDRQVLGILAPTLRDEIGWTSGQYGLIVASFTYAYAMGLLLNIAGGGSAHLRAMEAHGLRVLSADGDFEVRPPVAGDLTAIGAADVVFLGVKAHGLTSLAPQLRPLLGPDTVVVSTQNGIPWWYFQQHGGELVLANREDGGLRAELRLPTKR